jgi:hypothetical protein
VRDGSKSKPLDSRFDFAEILTLTVALFIRVGRNVVVVRSAADLANRALLAPLGTDLVHFRAMVGESGMLTRPMQQATGVNFTHTSTISGTVIVRQPDVR